MSAGGTCQLCAAAYYDSTVCNLTAANFDHEDLPDVTKHACYSVTCMFCAGTDRADRQSILTEFATPESCPCCVLLMRGRPVVPLLSGLGSVGPLWDEQVSVSPGDHGNIGSVTLEIAMILWGQCWFGN
jgi:hypothetical protein